MKTRILIITVVITASTGYGLFLLDQPKNAWDCRMKYGKGTDKMFECMDRISSKKEDQQEVARTLHFETCADLFDSIKHEFQVSLKNNPECNLDVCPEYEPPLFSSALNSNDEFIDSECAKFVDEWAYLTEDNDFTWKQIHWEAFVEHHYPEPISDSQRNENCANLFDLIYQSKDDSDLLYELTETNEFRDLKCASVVDEWDHLAEHNAWEIGISWDKVAEESKN